MNKINYKKQKSKTPNNLTFDLKAYV